MCFICTILFYLAQKNFIQAELAFIKATKLLRAAVVCNSPEQRTEACVTITFIQRIMINQVIY